MPTLDAREQRTLTKRCTKCGEVKPLEEFSPDKSKRDGRKPQCRACVAKRKREARWTKQGIPPEQWPRLHEEADRKAEAQATRHNSVPDGFKACSRCGEAKPLEEFPQDKHTRDGRYPWCCACRAKHRREASWKRQGIPASDWPLLHREADRQRRMRELAAQHGLKYCPDCDMCLGRGFFYRDASSADKRRGYCKACASARDAAYLRTPAGRAAKRGSDHRRRARERELPTDGTGPREWAAFAEEHEWFQCNLCDGDLNAEDEIHYDHVDPISTGTTGTVLHNMRAVHARCNLSRGNRPIDEWRAAMGLTDEIP